MQIPQLEPDVQALIDEVIDSLVKWDLVVYLYSSAGSCATPDEIANSCGRALDEVDAGLTDLIGSGLAVERRDDAQVCYEYESGNKWHDAVGRFVTALEDRNSRLQILARILGRITTV